MKASTVKGEASADRILDAAFASIAAKGCGQVTLRGIAEEAGVALSQLSYYYGTKGKLFAAVLARMQRGYLATLGTWLDEQKTLRGQALALVNYNENVLRESPDMYRSFLEFFNFAMSSESFRPYVAGFISEISTMIEARMTHRDHRDVEREGHSVSTITRFVLSSSFGISLQHLLAPDNTDVLMGFEVMRSALAHMLTEAA
ncbi:DNA-binding transcriptional regulator, AcrR family [Parafrankia irregularis]|uniref:DNA-binding transcriptional regulator, AcrR family n=1 Tax=Parafrankia irregularis TaxID=795642 RepID=A0A0S4QXB5_9ACTN|nr:MULTISPECIES: TetR/AcrR family transcriptional regulator [Parafrankia]MBE3200347.1 TetR/AcrR family transcriptional regulator [Parafrankia sp. CH37]CUU59775.1 DNA-binding transcriptional regulator, AcrR family [Parafrankia irregularis]